MDWLIMKKNFFPMLALVLMVSCKDYSTILVEKNGANITIVNAEIDSAQVIRWKVGSLFKYTVSKGVLVKLELPQLRAEDIQTLMDNYEIDSWIVRVSKDFSGRRHVLGEIFMPLQSSALSRMSSNSAAFFAVYYSAAAPSPRFENFQCPAFNHRKLIGDVDIEDNGIGWQTLAVGHNEQGSRESQLQQFSLDPITLNGGSSLFGTYIVELATFSHRTRTQKSSYIEYPQKVVVSEENEVTVGGCENSDIPAKQPDKLDMKSFKFKKSASDN
ncbi:MAG: hypothetical protein A2381_03310 [Bdellovibrionales bacterium RIFOXYB1_FULL_37_110]|nr:MAG: hypothetical protein A2181_00415 [Bdellovibrionales bacterium RIFOXYA1_FULL_38_20]OFZ48433.1 MAG: hypothetical protein A2417_03800 [Bdellovibrionales bacterium RIFOXYC1_FULL_37_79]OFZ57954.1 MAG: hypothetical protein A2381_03310 [Bdellovibrionales bacterium RIFOXYB1_FULL_37_110]OFZ63091.1 MAG: hypothetical protein A2577_15440 [Bdellovibrionales bacterium RIFOXYD1_FULL_36_51]